MGKEMTLFKVHLILLRAISVFYVCFLATSFGNTNLNTQNDANFCFFFKFFKIFVVVFVVFIVFFCFPIIMGQ